MRWCLVIFSLLAAPAIADAPLAGVGRLTFDGRGGCTGVLIAPDLVLTAGHCLANPNGRKKDALTVEFETGRYPGQPARVVSGAASEVHPLWFGETRETVRVIGHDIALLRLAAPLDDDVAPLRIGAPAREGERLMIASWFGKDARRARERFCVAVEARDPVAILGCRVDGGESGAPVLRLTDAGPEVVAIVSSRGEIGVQNLAFAAFASRSAAQLRALLIAVGDGG